MSARCVRRVIGLWLLLLPSFTPVLAAGYSQAIPGEVSDGPADTEAYVLLDGFEDPAWPNPDLWTVSGSVAPTWWPSSCRARSGRRSLWAFGGQAGAGALDCGARAPRGARSTLVQHLDLRGAARASRLELGFELWMQLPPGPDTGLFIFLRVPQAGGGLKLVPVFGATGGSGDWVFPARQLDLMNLADISDPHEVYDLRGAVWELEWVALAPNGTAPGAGVFIDDLVLVWEPDAALTPPTPRPSAAIPTSTASPTPGPATATPTATSTPTSSSTPRPPTSTTSTTVPTATPTRRPTPGSEDTPTPWPTNAHAYLPWLAREEVLWTATPDVTWTPTMATPETPAPTVSPPPTEPPKPPPLFLPWTAWEAAFPEATRETTTAATPPIEAIGDLGRSAYN